MNQSSTIHLRRHSGLAAVLLVGALALGAAGAVGGQPAAAGANEAPDSVLGWTLSEDFPNVRAWPESFDSLAFPNRCLFLSVLPCP